ncbi:MAG TPA: rod shape-determining protein MreD [Vicinamibacterales bacterium]|nr:rod shape-determining protein MreD [Vicinamibacterales bacterium]
MKTAGAILAIAVALVLQTTLTRFVFRGTFAPDLVLVVVVFVGLMWGPVAGLLAGTVAGLAQDALTSGVLGIGGLSKTIVGFLSGVIGTQFIVAAWLPRFVVFFGATAVNAAAFMGLYALLDLRHFGTPYARVAWEGLANAVIGLVLFQIVELLPGAVERRRVQKTGIRL